MNFSLTALNLTYPLLAGFVFCIAYILGLKRELSVLTKVVEMNEGNQNKINEANEKKFDTIAEKLEKIIDLILENNNGKK